MDYGQIKVYKLWGKINFSLNLWRWGILPQWQRKWLKQWCIPVTLWEVKAGGAQIQVQLEEFSNLVKSSLKIKTENKVWGCSWVQMPLFNMGWGQIINHQASLGSWRWSFRLMWHLPAKEHQRLLVITAVWQEANNGSSSLFLSTITTLRPWEGGDILILDSGLQNRERINLFKTPHW